MNTSSNGFNINNGVKKIIEMFPASTYHFNFCKLWFEKNSVKKKMIINNILPILILAPNKNIPARAWSTSKILWTSLEHVTWLANFSKTYQLNSNNFHQYKQINTIKINSSVSNTTTAGCNRSSFSPLCNNLFLQILHDQRLIKLTKCQILWLIHIFIDLMNTLVPRTKDR